MPTSGGEESVLRAVDPSENTTSIVEPCSVWSSVTAGAEATETGLIHWKSVNLSAYSEPTWKRHCRFQFRCSFKYDH